MGSAVSSLLSYLERNPTAKVPFGQISHELEHLKLRERVSSFSAVAATALLILGLAGVISGGAFIIGALAAIAGIAVLYAYCTREAESSLRNRHIEWGNSKPLPAAEDLASKLSPAECARRILPTNWLKQIGL